MSKTYFVSDTHFGHHNIIKYSKRLYALNDYPDIQKAVANAETDDDLRAIDIPKQATPVMEDFIFDKINAKVGPEDKLFILGDIGFANSAKQFGVRVRSWRDRILAGKIYLVVGNHERVPSIGLDLQSSENPQSRENYLEAIRDVFDGVFDQVMVYCENGIKVFCNHFPMISWPDCHKNGLPGHAKPHKTISLLAYGHVHGAFTKGQKNFKTDPLSLDFPWAGTDVGVDASDRWPWSAEDLFQKCLP